MPSQPGNAQKRLLRDLKEINSTKLYTICARPLENNLFEWHANLLAPNDSHYYGCCFHLRMLFTEDYPHEPPEVELLTKMQHPNVFRGMICLDMLNPHGPLDKKFCRWSSSYTVLSILLQLQSFLMSQEMFDNRTTERMMIDAGHSRSYKCFACNHSPTNPWPFEEHWEPLPTPQALKNISFPTIKAERPVSIHKPKKKKKAKKIKRLEKLFFLLDLLPEEVILHTLTFLQLEDLTPISQLGPQYHTLCHSPQLWARRETICFHSKVTFEEDVLGIGLNLEYNPKTFLLTGITTPMDLLSRTAFEDDVKKSAWGIPFEHWIPLYINKEHGKRSMLIFEEYIAKLFTSHKKSENVHIVTRVVDVLCKLMCSMIVEIMKRNMHASFKALEYYCHFHRLLIYYVEMYPELLKIINSRVERFIKDEYARSKNVTPNLGEFLPLLSVSDYSWNDVALAIVQEVMDRNSLWIKKKYHKLSITNAIDTDRLELSWNASHVGLRLIMFHAFFLQKVVDRSEGVTLDDMSWQYDCRFGKPTHEMQEAMQKAIFEIQKTQDYLSFFKYCQVPVQDADEARILLRKAMQNAFRRGYIFTQTNERKNNQTERKRYVIPANRSGNNNHRVGGDGAW